MICMYFRNILQCKIIVYNASEVETYKNNYNISVIYCKVRNQIITEPFFLQEQTCPCCRSSSCRCKSCHFLQCICWLFSACLRALSSCWRALSSCWRALSQCCCSQEIQLFVPETVYTKWTKLFSESLQKKLHKQSVKCNIVQTDNSMDKPAFTSNIHLLLAGPSSMRVESCIEHTLERFSCKYIFSIHINVVLLYKFLFVLLQYSSEISVF